MKKLTSDYAALGASHNEHNDCVVRALSLALNKPYDEIHAACIKHGRKPRRCTSSWTQTKVAQEYGMRSVDLYSINNSTRNMPTLTQFLKAHPNGHYYVARRGHAFTIIDGVVHDWASGTGPRSRIVRAWQAEDKP